MIIIFKAIYMIISGFISTVIAAIVFIYELSAYPGLLLSVVFFTALYAFVKWKKRKN